MNEDNDVGKRLESIERILSEYIETSLDNRDYRRAENIQILVALGVLGGLITYYVQDGVQESSFQVFLWLIGVSSAAFLLVKTLIPPLRFELDSGYLETLDDRLMPFLYAFFVLLSVFVGIITLVGRTLPNMAIPDVQYISTISALLSGIIVAAFSYLYSKRYEEVAQERARREQQVIHQVGRIREATVVDTLLKNPEILGEDIKINTVEQHPFGSVMVDLFAEDESGTPILIEVKAREARSKDVEQLTSMISKFNADNNLESAPRGILVAPVFAKSAQDRIDEIDHIQSVAFDPRTK